MLVGADEFDKILDCVRALQENFPADFILVGGAAARFYGHERVTYDVDILVRPKTVIDSLNSIQGFEVMAGKLSYRSVIIDLLTIIDNRFVYTQVQEHVQCVDGVRTLKYDFALAVKIRCFYLRLESSTDAKKRQTDLVDAVFWATLLEKSGEMISEICAAQFKIGCYHALLVRLNLELDDFRSCGTWALSGLSSHGRITRQSRRSSTL